MPTDDGGPGPSRDTHEVLMDATYRTLAESGYGDLSLRAVAEEAGKSRGLVHYHFESKHDLVVSLLDYLLEGLEADVEVTEGDDPESALRRLLDRVGYGPEDGDPDAYYRALYAIRSQAPFDEEIRARLTRNYGTLVDQATAIIEAGIDAGDFREVDPESTAAFLVVTVDGARNTDLSLDTDRTREQVFETLDAVVLPRLRADD